MDLKDVTQDIKETTKTTTGKVLILISVLSIVLYVILMNTNRVFGMWGEAIAGIALIMMMIFLIDWKWLTNLSIITEVKNGNSAVSILIGLLAIAFSIIIYACVGGSLVKFLQPAVG